MKTATVEQIKALESEGAQPVVLISEGGARDGFELKVPVPEWHSGSGEYESINRNVRSGTMVAFAGLEHLDTADFEALKTKLANLDVYPTGNKNTDNGDFSARPLKEYVDWFFQRSAVTDLQPQEPLANLGNLTPTGLGRQKYAALVDHLADNMRNFFDRDGKTFLIGDAAQRKTIAHGLLEGLSSSTRYTRTDKGASKAFLFDEPVQIEGTGTTVGPKTYAVIRPDGEITPLSIDGVRRPGEVSHARYIVVSPLEVTGLVSVDGLLQGIQAKGTRVKSDPGPAVSG